MFKSLSFPIILIECPLVLFISREINLELFHIIIKNRQTDRQNVLFAITITNMMIINETVKRQEISIKIDTIADMETTL